MFLINWTSSTFFNLVLGENKLILMTKRAAQQQQLILFIEILYNDLKKEVNFWLLIHIFLIQLR